MIIQIRGGIRILIAKEGTMGQFPTRIWYFSTRWGCLCAPLLETTGCLVSAHWHGRGAQFWARGRGFLRLDWTFPGSERVINQSGTGFSFWPCYQQFPGRLSEEVSQVIHGHWVTDASSCARPCAQMLHDAYCSYSGNLAKMERGKKPGGMGQRGETIATLQFSAFFSDIGQRKALQTIEPPSCRWLTPRRSRRFTIFQISRFIQVWHSMKSGEPITHLKSIKMHQSEVYRTAGSQMWQCSIHSKTCPGPGPRWGRNLLVGPSCELRWFQTCGVIWGDFGTELHPSKFFSSLAYACPIFEDTPCPQTCKHIISVLGSTWILAGECRGAWVRFRHGWLRWHWYLYLKAESHHDTPGDMPGIWNCSITCILVFVGEVGLADSTWIRH